MIQSCLTLTFVLSILTVSALTQTVLPDSGPKLVSGRDFQISAEDEAAGIDGTMKLALDVDSSGNVTRAEVYVMPMWHCSSGFEDRVNAVIRGAENAAMKFKFSPAIKNGKPIDSQAAIKMTVGPAARKAIEPEHGPLKQAGEPEVLNQVNVGVINGKAVSLPKPTYPAAAKGLRITGAVSVNILIGEDGKVMNAQAVDGPPLLHLPARAAACEAKFTPTLFQGKPVKVAGAITYYFKP